MRSLIKEFAIFTAICATITAAAFGQDTGAAVVNGDWNSPSTWTNGVPTSSSNVYIGSTNPSGAAVTATVSLTSTVSAANVYLGFGSGTSGTLDLAGNALTITGNLVIGQNGGMGTLNDSNGSFSAANAYVYGSGNSLTFGANDAVTYLQLNSGSVATTAAQGNVTGSIDVLTGSTLTLGANLTLSNTLNVQGSGSTLDMAGHAINAGTVNFAYNGVGSPPVTIENRGAITATYLYTGNGTFDLNPNDTVTNYYLSHGSSTLYGTVTNLELDSNSIATTTATGGPTVNASVYSGSTLTLGANLTLSNALDVEGTGSTLNMGGHSLNADFVALGYSGGTPVTIENRGAITANYLEVGTITFNLISSDSVTNYYLSNATTKFDSSVSVSSLLLERGSIATTTGAGNVTNSVSVFSGSTLNLNAPLITGSLDVRDTGSVVNLNGNAITASQIFLGASDGQAVTLNRGGPGGTLTTNYLAIGNETFKLVAGDSVYDLDVESRAIVTTATTATLTDAAFVESGGKLILGADATLISGISVQDSGSILDAQGHAITTDTLYAGVFGTSPVSVINLGLVTLNNLAADHGSLLTLHGGDTVNSSIDLAGGSVLTVQQMNKIGLTFNGTSLSDLTIDASSHSSIDLIFMPNSSSNWDFRWQDPSGGNWISTIDGLIGTGQIKITGANNYMVYDAGGYTYIGIVAASVPEPSSLVLACLAAVGVAVARASRRRRSGRWTWVGVAAD